MKILNISTKSLLQEAVMHTIKSHTARLFVCFCFAFFFFSLRRGPRVSLLRVCLSFCPAVSHSFSLLYVCLVFICVCVFSFNYFFIFFQFFPLQFYLVINVHYISRAYRAWLCENAALVGNFFNACYDDDDDDDDDDCPHNHYYYIICKGKQLLIS